MKQLKLNTVILLFVTVMLESPMAWSAQSCAGFEKFLSAINGNWGLEVSGQYKTTWRGEVHLSEPWKILSSDVELIETGEKFKLEISKNISASTGVPTYTLSTVSVTDPTHRATYILNNCSPNHYLFTREVRSEEQFSTQMIHLALEGSKLLFGVEGGDTYCIQENQGAAACASGGYYPTYMSRK